MVVVVVVVVGEGIMRHYDPPPDPNFLPCDFTDWAAHSTKAPRHTRHRQHHYLQTNIAQFNYLL